MKNPFRFILISFNKIIHSKDLFLKNLELENKYISKYFYALEKCSFFIKFHYLYYI